MKYLLTIIILFTLAGNAYGEEIRQAPIPKIQLLTKQELIKAEEALHRERIEKEEARKEALKQEEARQEAFKAEALKLEEKLKESYKNEEINKDDIIALYNANNLEGAYQLVSKVPELERDAQMWLILANITQDYSKDSDALLLLQKSVEKDPKYYKAYYNLGNAYFKENKIIKATENYQLAVKYNKNFAYGYYNLGCCYLKDMMYKKAKTNFLKAIKIKNDDPIFYYNLALAYKKMNNEKQAQKVFEIYEAFSKS